MAEKSVFRLPFAGLIAKVVLLCVFGVLLVVTAICYWSCTSLEDSLEQIRHANADYRVELVKLEARVGSARAGIGELLERERELRDESKKLRAEALELERDWEVAKMYKRRVDESGRKIEELRRRIRELGK
jgi:uncharacterized coiled-coil DUF342 family protein